MIQGRTTADQRALTKAHVETWGESANSFINRAIAEQRKRDKE